MKPTVFLWLCLFGYGLSARTAAAQYRIPPADVLAVYLFDGLEESLFRSQLEQQLETHIERLGQVAQLDTEQLSKLRWAAHGDLSRFYRDLERVRHETKQLDLRDRQQSQQLISLLKPLGLRLNRGLWDESSLLERMVGSVLTPEQAANYHQYLRQRQEARYRAIVNMTVADLEQVLPLTAKQREQLIKLLESKAYPRGASADVEEWLGYAMLIRLGEAEIKDLLDEQQLNTFRKIVAQHIQWMNNFTW